MLKSPISNTTPIFIGGEGRSGTRLLRNIIGKHKNIFEIGKETYLFIENSLKHKDLLKKAINKPDWDSVLLAIITTTTYKRSKATSIIKSGKYEAKQEEILAAIKETIPYKNFIQETKILNTKDLRLMAIHLVFDYLTKEASKRRWVEKTPSNIYIAEQLLTDHPKAKFIAMLRDPRAVVASWLKKDKLKSLIGVCFTWNKAARKINKLSKKLSKKQFKIIRFEDLLGFSDKTLVDLCDFAEEPVDQEIFEVQIVNNKERKFEKGFNQASLDRWREELSRTQIQLIEMLTIRYRNQFSYKDQENYVGVLEALSVIGLLCIELVKLPAFKLIKFLRR